jgi:hypothetical protein
MRDHRAPRRAQDGFVLSPNGEGVSRSLPEAGLHERGRTLARAARRGDRVHDEAAANGSLNGTTPNQIEATMNVAAWPQGLGLGQYEQAFRANDLDGEVLADLTADDLIAVGH